jgi:hypothetical protein
MGAGLALRMRVGCYTVSAYPPGPSWSGFIFARPIGLILPAGTVPGYRAAQASREAERRATARSVSMEFHWAVVLADVVREARHELLLMTYSAKPYQPLRDAPGAAASRGVAVSVVVETLRGASSALSGGAVVPSCSPPTQEEANRNPGKWAGVL